MEEEQILRLNFLSEFRVSFYRLENKFIFTKYTENPFVLLYAVDVSTPAKKQKMHLKKLKIKMIFYFAFPTINSSVLVR